ncbi:23S rRNA (pseudouridine(1915)-N(3))-methyltransferase RlmH [Candidatus Woesearchaeota archaeon]|nr:23S rRNA (pseudouridine(1915)-N(3))-methyltransferase RlmH [Candidatus Woesearchaeota archaeon]
MKLKLICVGKVKDENMRQLSLDYSRKIDYDANIEIVEIKDSTPEEEAKKIIELVDNIKDNIFVISLGEEGTELNSRDFAKRIKQVSMTKTIVFIIGGPFGLSEKIKNKSDLLLSLSNMTFTHEMARLFLLEQVYRAILILKNTKYHKD